MFPTQTKSVLLFGGVPKNLSIFGVVQRGCPGFDGSTLKIELAQLAVMRPRYSTREYTSGNTLAAKVKAAFAAPSFAPVVA